MYTYHPKSSKPPTPHQQNQATYSSKQQLSKKESQNAVDKYSEKFKVLGKVRYINQLAQLEYDDKMTELHSKYSSKAKQSVRNKMMAKNQMAEFVDEGEEFEEEFEELMEYKYGSKNKNYHYENESNKKEYIFCSLCDEIYIGSESAHENQCRYEEYVRSPLYYFESLDRIKKSLARLTSQEANELSILSERIKKSQDVSNELRNTMPLLKNDEVLGRIAAKLSQIIEELQ